MATFVNAKELAKCILDNKEFIGSASWDIYVMNDGTVDCRHDTHDNSGWTEIVDLYSFWNDNETLSCTVDELAAWLVSDDVVSFENNDIDLEKDVIMLDVTNNIVANNSGEAHFQDSDSLLDMIKQSILLNGTEFQYKVSNHIQRNDYSAEFNEDLNGYEIIFADGKVANTQFDLCTDALSAYFGDYILEPFDDFDDDIVDEQKEIVLDVCKAVNFAAAN